MSGLKGKFFIICSLLLIVVSVVFAIYLYDLQYVGANKIVIDQNEEHKIFNVADLKLIPSESKEYSLELVAKNSGDFTGTIDFVENADGGLKEYVDVRVEVDGQVLFEGKLADLIDNFNGQFNIHLETNVPAEIYILYSMDESVGNEVKNTYSDFSIDVKIERILGEK